MRIRLARHSGRLERLETSPAVQHGEARRYRLLVIGGQELSNIAAGNRLAPLLQPGRELELFIGTLFLTRYIFAIRTPDGLHKMPVTWFLGSAAAKLGFSLLAVAASKLGGMILSILVLALVALLWLRLIISFANYQMIR